MNCETRVTTTHACVDAAFPGNFSGQQNQKKTKKIFTVLSLGGSNELVFSNKKKNNTWWLQRWYVH